MQRILLILALCAFAAPAQGQRGAPDLAGRWNGVVRAPGEPTGFSVDLRAEGQGWTGTITVPGRGVDAVPLERVAMEGDTVVLRLPQGLAELRGTLSNEGRVLSGTARIEEGTVPFALARRGSSEANWLRREASAAGARAHAHPDSARIVAEDIPRFWAAYDASTPETRAAALDSLYLEPGSEGLRDMLFRRIGSAEALAQVVNAHPRYLASARASTLRAAEFEPRIREAFRRLEEVYPDAVFPDVYFLIGRMNSGGTTSPRALLIGTELYGRTPEMPLDELGSWHRAVLQPIELIPHIVAHELIHYQQEYADGQTLLRQALVEGVADFVAELISGRHINAAAAEYGDAHEALLWCEFEDQMEGTDVSRWLYNGDQSVDRPADLGYYMGYRIARAYHAQAPDKRQAVHDMLRIQDFRAFLDASGYAAQFGCGGVAPGA